MEQTKKRILSGSAPSGYITLGNYLGALKNWVQLQDEYECLFSIVDLHAITVRQDPALLRKRSLEFLAQYIACGIDPEKNILFFQSHVSTHAELSWILNCFTSFGELSRMTQFKDKSQKHTDNINVGLFDYPVLMAADILLYQTDLVPVGEDQKQHLELTRDIATRFNNIYGEVFKIPEVYIPKVGARIMSLQEPTKKMSKSDENENNYILVLDEPNVIRKKIKRAVTDSLGIVQYSDEQPGIKNLLTIYSALTGESIENIVSKYEGKGYGDFKNDTAEVVAASLEPIHNKYKELMANKDYLEQVYKKGAEKAYHLSYKTLRKVHKKLGFVAR